MHYIRDIDPHPLSGLVNAISCRDSASSTALLTRSMGQIDIPNFLGFRHTRAMTLDTLIPLFLSIGRLC